MPAYLRNKHTDSGLVTDYRDWAFPLGRRFRALKIWFVLRTYGVQGIKAYLRNHVALNEEFAGWVRARDDLFELVAEPAFALTAFTIAPQAVAEGVDDDESTTDEKNEIQPMSVAHDGMMMPPPPLYSSCRVSNVTDGIDRGACSEGAT